MNGMSDENWLLGMLADLPACQPSTASVRRVRDRAHALLERQRRPRDGRAGRLVSTLANGLGLLVPILYLGGALARVVQTYRVIE
jgi:hypothetical protein